MVPLRVAIGFLIAAAIGVALIPLAVLLDLHEGGTGWGLCQEGLDGCNNSYFAGFEMLGAVAIVFFVIIGLIALLVRMLRAWERRQPVQQHAQQPWPVPQQTQQQQPAPQRPTERGPGA